MACWKWSPVNWQTESYFSMKSAFKLAVVTPLVASLLGCGINSEFKRTDESMQNVIGSVERGKQQLVKNASTGAVTTMARPRIAGEKIQLRKDGLPPVFFRSFQYRTHGSESLVDVLRAVGDMTGLGIRSAEVMGSSASSSMSTQGMQAPGGTDALSAKPLILNFSGTLSGFLDEVAAQQDVSWRYNDKSGDVELYRYETRAISLSLAPGRKNVDASINLAGIGGSGSTGNVNISHSISVDPWTSVMSGVRTILGIESSSPGAGASSASGGAQGGAAAPGGGATGAALSVNGKNGFAVANPELGIVTVTGRPIVVARVANYLESVNRRFAQNVLIDVRVFNVTLNSNATAGVSFSFLKEALGKYNLSVVSSDLIRPDSGTPSLMTVNSQNPSGTALSSLVVEALQQAGRVTLVTQGQVFAVNGRPSPFQQAREIPYVASSSTTTVPNVGLTTTTQQASKVVGFTANFLPLILGDNRIFLQYQIQSSSLLAMRQITSNGNITQLPEVASQSLQQEAFLKDGQALMLFAFDQERQTESDANGVISVSKSALTERNMNVVFIQVNTGTKHADR